MCKLFEKDCLGRLKRSFTKIDLKHHQFALTDILQKKKLISVQHQTLCECAAFQLSSLSFGFLIHTSFSFSLCYDMGIKFPESRRAETARRVLALKACRASRADLNSSLTSQTFFSFVEELQRFDVLAGGCSHGEHQNIDPHGV